MSHYQLPSQSNTTPLASAAGDDVLAGQLQGLLKTSKKSAGKSARKRQNRKSSGKEWETMARKGLLRHIPSGTFYGRTRYKGKLIRKSLETDDYNIACDRLEHYKRRWRKECDEELKKSQRHDPTTWDLAKEQFLTDSWGMAQREEISHCTLEIRGRIADKITYYWQGLGSISVRDIAPEKAKEFFTNAATGKGPFDIKRVPPRGQHRKPRVYDGGACCPGQYNAMLWVCNKIVGIARTRDVEHQHGTFANPFGDLKPQSETTKIPTMPTDEEFQAILDFISAPRHSVGQAHSYRTGALTKFLAMTGARIGEVLGGKGRAHPEDPEHPGFRWRDIKDRGEAKYFIFTCEKKFRNHDNYRKVRQVPFIDGMEEFINELRAKWYTGDDNALVFRKTIPGVKNSGISPVCGINLVLKRACRILKLPHLSQKDLRHFFATKLVEAKFSWTEIADALGHEDGGILAAATYAHLRPSNMFLAAKKVRIGKKNDDDKHEKILIGGKQYTIAELEKMLAGK